VPEGKEARWDAEQQVAISDAYNTLHFATPLVELPVERITPVEEQTYRDFRQEYLRLWRRFFDPVGVRFALDKKQVKLDVYILPMIANDEYNNLRWLAGTVATRFDLARLSPRSLLQFTMSLGPPLDTSLGGWGMIRLDDNRTLARLVEWWLWHDLVQAVPNQRVDEVARLVLQLPITAGVGIKNAATFSKEQTKFIDEIRTFLGPVSVKDVRYNGSIITEARFGPDSALVKQLNEHVLKGKLSEVVLYHTAVEDGWYVGLDEGALKDLIDRAEERKTKKFADAQTIPINASWYLSPQSADQAGPALRQYLEWETHKRALLNNPLWYVLYRTRVINGETPERTRREAAHRFLGFVPVSPDEAPYRYDARTGEVINQRHGSLGRPQLHAGIAEKSPLVEILACFPSLRVDLRFREDGFHSVITVKRK
jgi:hypothetical protein